MSKKSTIGGNKWDELYNDKDRFNKNTKRDLKDDERDMMKNDEEYSF